MGAGSIAYTREELIGADAFDKVRWLCRLCGGGGTLRKVWGLCRGVRAVWKCFPTFRLAAMVAALICCSPP